LHGRHILRGERQKPLEKLISVVGGYKSSPEIEALAEEVGKELAKAGAVLVCGGLGGVMEAACRGAVSEGGKTIGILPGAERDEANPFVQFALPTGLGFARNVIVAQATQAVIAVDGSYGTLSEIALALNKGIPVIGLKTWQLFLDGKEDRGIRVASTAREAVKLALKAAETRSQK